MRGNDVPAANFFICTSNLATAEEVIPIGCISSTDKNSTTNIEKRQRSRQEENLGLLCECFLQGSSKFSKNVGLFNKTTSTELKHGCNILVF